MQKNHSLPNNLTKLSCSLNMRCPALFISIYKLKNCRGTGSQVGKTTTSTGGSIAAD